MQLTVPTLVLGFSLIPSVVGHATAWHQSMFGLNYTKANNKPQDPLQDRVFGGENGWWFHGHLDYPPSKEDFLEFPAGGETFVEVTCDKGASSQYVTNPGGDIRDGNHVCPGASTLEYHTTGINDVKGCAFAISYTPATQASSIQPEDFVVFSVNHTCVWERFTKFEVPADMPACPPEGCTCAWFWIHSQDAGSEQIYMNAYQCKITGAKSTTPLAKPQIARRCGADNDPELVKPAAPQNCTYGAKQPLYWIQKERNNMFEGPHAPPFYNDLYGFKDGAQTDIFVNSVLPKMDWSGAPVSGQLKQVAGVFSGSGSSPAAPPAAAPPADASPSPSPSSTPASAPSNVNSAPAPESTDAAPTSPSDPAPEPSATQKGNSNHTKGGSTRKTCRKPAGQMKMMKKRSILDGIISHRRRSSGLGRRRH